jgi:integrase
MQSGSEPWIPDKQLLEICHCRSETILLTPNSSCEARWPIGTRERLALAILLYTGLRRGDAAMLGRQHVRDGIITFRTAKTGTQVTIPMLPDLAEIIAATKTGDLAFVATPSGRPMTKESFGNWFKDTCRAAGVPGTARDAGRQ